MKWAMDGYGMLYVTSRLTHQLANYMAHLCTIGTIGIDPIPRGCNFWCSLETEKGTSTYHRKEAHDQQFRNLVVNDCRGWSPGAVDI